MPVAEVHELCYQILVRMVPSLVEENLDEFGAAVNRVQEIGFKKIEVMLQHPVVHRLMAAMREAGAACAGLSLLWAGRLCHNGYRRTGYRGCRQRGHERCGWRGPVHPRQK